jgi:TIGR03009 family protein
MSRMLKPAVAGLAISSLCLSFVAEIPAQVAGKKKAAIKQTQAVEDSPADDTLEKGKTNAPPAKAKQGQIARPVVNPLQVDPALEKVLKDWEQHTSQFKKLAGEFEVFKYDPIFLIEKRAAGKFVHEAPDKGNYERLATEIDPKEKSKKTDKNGTPYKLESDSPERWVCTGKEVIKIDMRERTYDRMPIAPENQGQNIIDGPLPFLFGMKADRAKKRYKLKLLRKNDTEIWLQAVPRWDTDAGNWEKAVIIIDAEKFVPNAVKLYDPTGAETVHIFKNIEINPKRGFLDWGPDPFVPKLRGFRPVNSGDKAPPGERLTPASNPRQSDAPAKKTRAAGEGFDRSADVSDAPAQRKKSATNRN